MELHLHLFSSYKPFCWLPYSSILRQLSNRTSTSHSTTFKMKLIIKRPKTPPTTSLLTPPPTGGFNKQVNFAEENVTNSYSRRLTWPGDGESPNMFSEDIQEVPNTDLVPRDNETNPYIGNTAITSPSPATSKSSVAEKPVSFPLLDPVVAQRGDIDPFPFLKLPLYLRNKIYEHLLVIPAIICVRQKHTPFHDEQGAFLYAERRELLPGIAYALAQVTVDGNKIRFSRFNATNINILCASKGVYAEAKAVLYGKNSFQIVRPTNEMSPPPDFSVRLFPPGCQRLVANLNICIRSFFDLHWILRGGYNTLKNYYRGLKSLTLILELTSTARGFGRQWARKKDEKWCAFIERLHGKLTKDLFGDPNVRKMKMKAIPIWINLRVLFSGERYDENLCISSDNVGANDYKAAEQIKREELKHALVETWALFKKDG